MTAIRRAGLRAPATMLLALWLAACATTPPPVVDAQTENKPPVVAAAVAPAAPLPAVESPPFEPVRAPLPVATPALPAAAAAPVIVIPSPPLPETEAIATPAPSAVAVPPAEPTDEQLVVALVADLQRFTTLGADELRRELAVVTQALTRQRNDANRTRLAMLYTLSRNPQDDQRALQLFDTVTKGTTGSPAVKQLAVVLQIQVAERVRAVREEQQKTDAAVQKLEALRAMERSLLRDRVRSGGGGGGGGGSGGGN
jgi:hypothetical protein